MSFCSNKYLAGPILTIEVTDNALASLNDGEEILLRADLGVLPVAEGDPTAALLRHFLHLLQPPLSKSLQIVKVKAIESRNLLVDLVLDGFRHCQHLLLQDLKD